MSSVFTISERQLEDMFCAAISARQNWKVIARQMHLDCGIVDAFVFDAERSGLWGRFYRVVELKVEPLKSRHLAQVLSYVCELKSKHPDKNISATLIGPSIEDKHLMGCVKHLSGGAAAPAVASYGLFNFDPLTGIVFDWVSKKQESLEEKRAEWHSSRLDTLIDIERGSSLRVADIACNMYGEATYAE